MAAFILNDYGQSIFWHYALLTFVCIYHYRTKFKSNTSTSTILLLQSTWMDGRWTVGGTRRTRKKTLAGTEGMEPSVRTASVRNLIQTFFVTRSHCAVSSGMLTGEFLQHFLSEWDFFACYWYSKQQQDVFPQNDSRLSFASSSFVWWCTTSITCIDVSSWSWCRFGMDDGHGRMLNGKKKALVWWERWESKEGWSRPRKTKWYCRGHHMLNQPLVAA